MIYILDVMVINIKAFFSYILKETLTSVFATMDILGHLRYVVVSVYNPLHL